MLELYIRSDTPGYVFKQAREFDNGGYDFRCLVAEADAQSIAADMGYAPKVRGVEMFLANIR